MYQTILKWVALVGLVLGVLALPFWYIGKVEKEAYTRGLSEATAACAEERARGASVALAEAQRILDEEAKRTRTLATELAKQRNDAKTLKGKLDEALKKQPEVAGCSLSPDAADILRFAAEGNFDAAAEQDASVSRTHVNQVPGEFAVPDQRQTSGPSGIGRNLLLGN
jgi:uncharacterized protein HemX